MAERYKRYIDPNFYIPDGIPPEIWEQGRGPGADEESSIFDNVDEGDDSSDDSPDTIDELTVISQKIRRTKEGSVVVDIVVETDDVRGATKYEFRITKK